jgi:hypothetical protein
LIAIFLTVVFLFLVVFFVIRLVPKEEIGSDRSIRGAAFGKF